MDIRIENHGSIVLVRPITDVARSWLNENVDSEAQWFGGALACEPRYVDNLINGLLSAGFTVTG